MLGDYLYYLQVVGSHSVATHLATHAHTLEHLCGIRTCTDTTGLAQTVVLTVSGLTYTAETMTLDNALEAAALGGTDDINEVAAFKHLHGDSVTKVQFLVKTCELGQVSLGCHTGLLEVAERRSRSVLLLLVLKAELDGIVAVTLYALYLSDYTRTQFDNSAWYVLTLGTEYGSHSDFLS